MTPRLGLYEKAICFNLDWGAKLELARSSGFAFLELNIDAADNRLPRLYRGNEAADLRRAVEAEGFPVETMALTANRGYPLGSETAAIREKGLDIVKRGIAFAHEAGIRLIHLAGYDEHGEKRNPRTERLFFNSITACVREASAAGVMLAVETMDTPFMASVERIMTLVRMIDSPYLQCYVDVGNITASGLDPVKEIHVGGRHIVGIHLKDTKPGVYRDIPFGEGTVNFDLCLQALVSIGHNGFYTAETWSYDNESFHCYLPKVSAFLLPKLENAYKGETL
ncbi:MAG: L-ribulose-5-phosphate 3-epimerase [Treponema sp.]|jgi:predicted hexulose-6-phosphate isomerase|nr:L-ribulose-5-phosphate 3-epimerase [Treponema sp.]